MKIRNGLETKPSEFSRGLRASRGGYRAKYQILSLPCNYFLPEVGVETRVTALAAASLAICFNYQLEDSERSFVSFFFSPLAIFSLLFYSFNQDAPGQPTYN